MNWHCLNIWKVCPIYSVAKLQNKTEHLEQELRNTNNKVSSLTNDGTSRKQDCIALLNKLQSIEQKTNTLDVRHNVTTAVLQGELHNINNRGEYIFSFNKVQRPSWSWSCRIYDHLWKQRISPLKLWVRIPLMQGALDTTSCAKVLSVTVGKSMVFSVY